MFSFLMFGFMSANAAPQDYTLSTKGSNLYVTVYKNDKTLLSAAAHNHAIRARKLTSTLQWDPENPAACKINISFNVEDLEVDSDQSRSLAASKERDPDIKKGFEKTISASDRKVVRKNMLSKGQLNSAKYKKISFTSTSCTEKSVTGDFTLRGVTKSITMPARIKVDDTGKTKFSVKGSFPITSTDFGFKAYSDLGGAVANKAKMKVHVRLRAN